MVVFLFFIPTILLGKEEQISDSLRLKQNTTELKKDTDSNTKSPTKTSTKSKIDAKIDYKSRDSIVLWRNGTGFLYGEGEAIY